MWDIWDIRDICLCWDIMIFGEIGGKVCMLEGGVEATGGRGDFSGMVQAGKHFAEVVVVESGWKRYFAGWARRQPSARTSLARMGQARPGYTQRALIRVRPTRFLGWPDGNFQQAPEVVEVTND